MIHDAVAPDGCRLRYDIEGEGPCLLLAPGLGGVGAFWDPVRATLAPGRRILTFDHRGCGQSDRPNQAYAVEGLAADVVAILDHAGVGQADVVGHSTGAGIAQVLAIDHPNRIRRVVAGGGWARPDPRFEALFQHRIAVLEGSGPVAYTRQSQLLGHPAAWFSAHVEEMDRALESAAAALDPLPVAVARLRMLLAFDRSADLARVRAPALVLAAPDDQIIPVEMSRELAALIPGSIFAEMPGGHFFPRVHPSAYAVLVADFLSAP